MFLNLSSLTKTISNLLTITMTEFLDPGPATVYNFDRVESKLKISSITDSVIKKPLKVQPESNHSIITDLIYSIILLSVRANLLSQNPEVS